MTLPCQILIDGRERQSQNSFLIMELYDRQKWQPNELGMATLELFDIVYDQNGVRRAAFERKTAADVLASFRDKRLQEQLGRISAYANAHPDVVVGYLIEGDLKKQNYGTITPLHIKHELWNLSRYGIVVVYTANCDETCDYLLYMRTVFSKELSIEQARASAEQNRQLYVGRKKDVTEKEMLFQSLKIISGVSPAHAKAICDAYDSLSELCFALVENPQLLNGFSVSDSKKIGKALAAKIFRMLVNPCK